MLFQSIFRKTGVLKCTRPGEKAQARPPDYRFSKIQHFREKFPFPTPSQGRQSTLTRMHCGPNMDSAAAHVSTRPVPVFVQPPVDMDDNRPHKLLLSQIRLESLLSPGFSTTVRIRKYKNVIFCQGFSNSGSVSM